MYDVILAPDWTKSNMASLASLFVFTFVFCLLS